MTRRRHKRMAVALLIVGALCLTAALVLALCSHALLATELRHLLQAAALACALEVSWHLGWLSRDEKPPVADGRVP